MRISDWSSDVCSSDLPDQLRQPLLLTAMAEVGVVMTNIPGAKKAGAKQREKSVNASEEALTLAAISRDFPDDLASAQQHDALEAFAQFTGFGMTEEYRRAEWQRHALGQAQRCLHFARTDRKSGVEGKDG